MIVNDLMRFIEEGGQKGTSAVTSSSKRIVPAPRVL